MIGGRLERESRNENRVVAGVDVGATTAKRQPSVAEIAQSLHWAQNQLMSWPSRSKAR